MMTVVERALRTIFEPMTQDERDSHISFLRTHFESTPVVMTTTSTSCGSTPKRKGRFVKGSLPYYMKQITGIDESKTGGYCFEGPFVTALKLGSLSEGEPLLIGTKSSPKKYCLAKVKRNAALTFADAEGIEIRVEGAEMISLHVDVKELIETLKALHLLKS